MVRKNIRNWLEVYHKDGNFHHEHGNFIRGSRSRFSKWSGPDVHVGKSLQVSLSKVDAAQFNQEELGALRALRAGNSITQDHFRHVGAARVLQEPRTDD